MFEETIKKAMKPIIKEVYIEGYKDGERRILEAFRYGWNVGHAETMAVLGEIDIQELANDEARKIFEEVKA